MMFLVILVVAVATASGLDSPSKEIKSRSIVVPIASADDRIGRGRNAVNEELPFHVRLLLKDSNNKMSWCSGSLIDNEWVLTAAYCTQDTKEAWVHLGAEVVHKVTNENFIIHSDWDSAILKNDISLVHIPYTHFSEKIQPVKLPFAGSFYGTYDGDEVITSGWCRLPDSSDISNINLSNTHMSVIPNSECRRFYGSVVRPSHICVGTYDGSSSCIGESGSPLILKTSKTQIGLTSFGHRNANEKSIPAVFTRINYYLDWIKEKTGVSA